MKAEELPPQAATIIERWRAAPAAEIRDGALWIHPGAPEADARRWTFADDGTLEGPAALSLDEAAEQAWPGWNRSLRVALGRAAGAEDEAEANRLGRLMVRTSGADMRAARTRTLEVTNDFWDEEVLSLLREVGDVNPRLEIYNACARSRDIVAQCLPESRNVAALALRVGGSAEWEWTGSVVGSVRAFLAAESWPKAQRKAAWRRFLRLPPSTAVRLDAAQAAMLALIPDRKDMVVERLSSGVLQAAAQFCAQYGHEHAPTVAAAMIEEAGKVRVDHGVLLTRFLEVEERLRTGGWPDEIGRWSWGGMVRRLERTARDLRDEQLAEEQASLEAADERTWPRTLDSYDDGRYRLRELVTGGGLAEEGALMHHCVGTYSDRCMSGVVRIFSVTLDSRRIATASLRQRREDGAPESRWSLSELHGYRNAAATKELTSVGKRLAERFEAAVTATGKDGE